MLTNRIITKPIYSYNNIPLLYKLIFPEDKNKLYNTFVVIFTFLIQKYRNYEIHKSKNNNENDSLKEVWIYLKSNMYNIKYLNKLIKENPEKKSLLAWKRLIKINNLTFRKVKQTLIRLEQLNIINILKGYKKFTLGENTTKDKIEWLEKPGSEITKIFLKSSHSWIYWIVKNKEDYLKVFAEKSSLTLNEKKHKAPAIYKDKNDNRIACSLKERKRVNTINKYYEKKGYKGFYYQRIFGQTTNDYGRLYNSLQHISKIERKKLLESSNYAETDFKSFAPNLLYLIETDKKYQGDDFYSDIWKEYKPKIDNNFDIYTSENQNKFIKENPDIIKKYYRQLMKDFSVIILNNESESEIIKSINFCLNVKYRYYKEKNSENLYYIENNIPFDVPRIYINAASIIEAFKKTHYKIKRFFFGKHQAWIQKIESEIMMDLLNIAIKNNHIIFGIHDCVCVPKEYLNYYSNLKEELLIKHLNIFLDNNKIIKFDFIMNEMLEFIKNNKIKFSNKQLLTASKVEKEIIKILFENKDNKLYKFFNLNKLNNLINKYINLYYNFTNYNKFSFFIKSVLINTSILGYQKKEMSLKERLDIICNGKNDELSFKNLNFEGSG